MNKRSYFLALVCLAVLACSVSSLGEVGNIENISADDAAMNAAIQDAQDTLPLFIEAFQSPSTTQNLFLIKARFPYGEEGNAEHIWINDLSYSNNDFEGTLGNEPIYVTDIHLGDQVTVNISNVSDWMIIDDNEVLGGFTIHVVRDRMIEKERERIDREFGFVIPDEPALP